MSIQARSTGVTGPVRDWMTRRPVTVGEDCPIGVALARMRAADVRHLVVVDGDRVTGIVSNRDVRRLFEASDRQPRLAEPVRRIMVPAGQELLLGIVRDPQFGPVVVVGFGGIYVEVLKDTAARLAPLTVSDALVMLDALRMAPALRGVRGEPPVDRAALAETIMSVGRLALDFPELAEMEVNPLIASRSGAVAVDGRASLAASKGSHGNPQESGQE